MTGIAAGCLAAAVMSGFQAVLVKMMAPATQEDAPAVKMIQTAAGRKLGRFEKPIANQAVHYASGALLGAVYGFLAELWPRSAAGTGAAYGVSTFLILDEGLVPVMGLSGPARYYPLSTHLRSLASHVVYGVTLELARRLMRPGVTRAPVKE